MVEGPWFLLGLFPLPQDSATAVAFHSHIFFFQKRLAISVDKSCQDRFFHFHEVFWGKEVRYLVFGQVCPKPSEVGATLMLRVWVGAGEGVRAERTEIKTQMGSLTPRPLIPTA